MDCVVQQPTQDQALSGDCDMQEFIKNWFNTPFLTSKDYAKRVAPSKRMGGSATESAFVGVASILANIPAYELFEKRIALFTASSGGMSWFLVLRIKGDTNRIRDALSTNI